MSTSRPAARTNKRKFLMLGGILVVAFVAVAGFGIRRQFFRDDAPPPVSLGSAVSSIHDATPTIAATTSDPATSTSVADSTPATSADATSTATADPPDDPTPTTASADPAGAGDLDGDWTIDDSQDGFVGYRVTENLARIGTTEAVGRTSEINGSATISGGAVSAASFEADLTSLESDESLRDGQLRTQAIETGQYPTASFTLTQPIDLGSDLAGGTATQVVAHGELTLHGVTKPVDITLDLQYTNGVIVAVGSLQIQFSDYNIESPHSMRVVSVEDHGTMELQLYFKPAA